MGQRTVYEAGDQRNVKDSEVKHAERYKEGKPNSHLSNDSSTSKSCFDVFHVLLANITYTLFDKRIKGQLRTDSQTKNRCANSMIRKQTSQLTSSKAQG